MCDPTTASIGIENLLNLHTCTNILIQLDIIGMNGKSMCIVIVEKGMSINVD